MLEVFICFHPKKTTPAVFICFHPPKRAIYPRREPFSQLIFPPRRPPIVYHLDSKKRSWCLNGNLQSSFQRFSKPKNPKTTPDLVNSSSVPFFFLLVLSFLQAAVQQDVAGRPEGLEIAHLRLPEDPLPAFRRSCERKSAKHRHVSVFKKMSLRARRNMKNRHLWVWTVHPLKQMFVWKTLTKTMWKLLLGEIRQF